MKKDIHPDYRVTEVTCTCGNTFTTRSTASSGTIHADVCSNCHPFYTGKQKILDTGGRVARFEARYAKMAKKDGRRRRPTTRPSPRPSSVADGADLLHGVGVVVMSGPSGPGGPTSEGAHARCSRASKACSVSTPSSSAGSPCPRPTRTRGRRRSSTSGTPS